MKSTLALILFAACAASPAPTDSPSSVQTRLAAEPASLFVPTTVDAGMLGAEHYTSSGWQSGSAAISIANGEFVVALDSDANVVASTFDVSFAPIDIPESVFGSPAQLTNVRLQLPAPASAAIAWSDADDATASVPLVLSLSWSLDVNGGTLPLGAQTLPAIPLEVALSGDGTTVSASLALHGSGELWQWADLLKLTELELSATAETTATE